MGELLMGILMDEVLMGIRMGDPTATERDITALTSERTLVEPFSVRVLQYFLKPKKMS
jgi:hypothetical protein